MLYFSPFIHAIRHDFFASRSALRAGICLGWNEMNWNEFLFAIHQERIRFDFIRMFRENATRPTFKLFQVIKLKLVSPLPHSFIYNGMQMHPTHSAYIHSLSSFLSAWFRHQMNSTQLRSHKFVYFYPYVVDIWIRLQQSVLRIHTWKALNVWFILTFDVYTIESIDTLTLFNSSQVT